MLVVLMTLGYAQICRLLKSHHDVTNKRKQVAVIKQYA